MDTFVINVAEAWMKASEQVKMVTSTNSAPYNPKIFPHRSELEVDIFTQQTDLTTNGESNLCLQNIKEFKSKKGNNHIYFLTVTNKK